MELLKKVLAKITPKDNSIKKEIDEVVKNINSELKKNRIKREKNLIIVKKFTDIKVKIEKKI